MNANAIKTVFRSIFLISLFLFRPASAQTPTNSCASQLNSLKGVLIFNPTFGESNGGNRVFYHWYVVTGTDFYIRTEYWNGDALLIEGPVFLGPYDLVLPDS
jgi:hypothetical protein